MNFSSKGPLTTDSEFFSSLRSDIQELSAVIELYNSGKQSSAEKEFLHYIKTSLRKDKYLTAIRFDPSSEPDDLTKKQAEEALEFNMVSCDIYHKFDGSVDWFSNHTYNNYEEWTWQLSRHRQVLDLAWVYYKTKDEKYAKRAISLLCGWMEQAVSPSRETDGHTTLCWRTIECGIRMTVWAKSLIMLLDSVHFTPRFAVNVFKSIHEHAERLYYKFTAANWLTIEMNGLYTASLLYPFFKKSDAWRNLAKNTFINQMYEQTLDDGTHYELTFGYQRVALAGFCNALRLGRAFGDEFPEKYYKKLKSQIHALIKTTMPNGNAPNVNDGKLPDVFNFIKEVADLLPDDELLSFALNKDNEGNSAPSFTSVLLENAGFVIFRSDWSSNAVAGFFDGGKFGRCHNHEDVIRCHQHEDKLNFLMYLGEKNIICEAESYAYDTSKMRYHVLSSAGHNTVLVNGEGQSRLINNHWDNSMLSSVEDVKFVDLGNIEYAKAKYNEGYGKNCDTNVTHERTIYFVKKPDVGLPFFIIKDKVSSSSENKYDVVWHYDTKDLYINKDQTRCDEMTTFFAGKNGKITLYNGSQEPFAGWKANSFTQNDFRGIPTVYYSFSGKNEEVISAFVPNIDNKCPVCSINYTSGKISVYYCNGSSLTIDF